MQGNHFEVIITGGIIKLNFGRNGQCVISIISERECFNLPHQ